VQPREVVDREAGDLPARALRVDRADVVGRALLVEDGRADLGALDQDADLLPLAADLGDPPGLVVGLEAAAEVREVAQVAQAAAYDDRGGGHAGRGSGEGEQGDRADDGEGGGHATTVTPPVVRLL
jgi:hypothetical protein